jgi:hypothetical protein
MMIVTLIDIFINTYKQMLTTASSYQGILFTDGVSLWGWSPPSFFSDFSYLYAL